MGPGRRLPRSFFRRPTLQVAADLLGQRLVRLDRGLRLSGRILEAEAYLGQADLGCHARVGRTERNRSMWGEPGHAYVYFTYGMHWCLNVVTERDGRPAAVLLRALWPEEGIPLMRRRRSGRDDLTGGPAKLCQALGIDGSFDGHDLCRRSARLFLEAAPGPPAGSIRRGPRVGLDGVPEPWKSKPWRFRLTAKAVAALSEEESR
jgi:DNA-3-methyladenine glycosylase